MDTTSIDIKEDVKPSFELVNAICRGCLTTNRNMISAVVFGSLFKDLTGIVVTESDGLPQWLCYECSALLTKSVRFQRKMLKAHNILNQYLTKCPPFPIDANDKELSKYRSPYLTQTVTRSCDLIKGKNGSYQVIEYENQPNNTALDDSPLLDLPKLESDVKEEMCFSDYDENITLEEFRSTPNEMMEDDSESLLRPITPTGVDEIEMKKKQNAEKKPEEKKNKISDDEKTEGETGVKSSSRKIITLDPQKIRIITLSLEEQIKQKKEEARTNLKFPFQCNLCHKGFNFEAKLANHMNNHSPSRGPLECKLCKMYFPTSDRFKTHSLIHARQYECVDCGRRMIDKSAIINHYRTQHEGMVTLFACDICGKVSNNNKTHKGHMRNHHGADRPKCEQCGKTFINKNTLTEHLQIHQGIKNHECSICGTKFRTRTMLNNHQSKHIDVKEFYCVECDARFKSEHHLRAHLHKTLRHKVKGSLIHGCRWCEQRFETRAAVRAHARAQHEGALAHVCATCGVALASAASLAQHALNMHPARPAPPKYACHICGKLFRKNQVLTNHMRTHTGERPFECSSCGRKFAQKAALCTHVKLVHLKMRRQPKAKPKVPNEQSSPTPKLEVFKPDSPLEP